MTTRVLGWLLVVVVLSSCTCSPNYTLNSGTIGDDDVEEPLSIGAKKFAPLLDRSNEIVKLLEDSHYQEVYSRFFDPTLKAQFSEPQFESLCKKLTTEFGPVQTFKTQQWKFAVSHRAGMSLIDSIKIVHHARGTLAYVITFSDEHADKIIGLHFHVRVPRRTVP